MADRYCALPRTSAYGAVSVLLQSVFSIEKIRNLPPEVFYPRPQVDSAVLRLTRHPTLPTNLAPFYAFIKKGFSQRRKKLKGLLPVNLDLRAEELDPTQWRDLYESTRREL